MGNRSRAAGNGAGVMEWMVDYACPRRLWRCHWRRVGRFRVGGRPCRRTLSSVGNSDDWRSRARRDDHHVADEGPEGPSSGHYSMHQGNAVHQERLSRSLQGAVRLFPLGSPRRTDHPRRPSFSARGEHDFSEIPQHHQESSCDRIHLQRVDALDRRDGAARAIAGTFERGTQGHGGKSITHPWGCW